MSGDAANLALPLSRLSTGACEATNLYRELRKPLLRYLVCLGLSSDEAQDVVQDAFLILHRHLASGGSQENIRGWLFRVAHNQARNRQNRYDRNFSAARRAPCGPEIYEYNLAFPRGGRHRIAIEIGNQERRHRLRMAREPYYVVLRRIRFGNRLANGRSRCRW